MNCFPNHESIASMLALAIVISILGLKIGSIMLLSLDPLIVSRELVQNILCIPSSLAAQNHILASYAETHKWTDSWMQ